MLNKEKVDTIIADTSIRLGILSEFQFSVISAFVPIVKNIKENINLIQDALSMKCSIMENLKSMSAIVTERKYPYGLSPVKCLQRIA